MNAPEVRYKTVCLHISPVPDFTRQFGEAVKAAGGKYSDVRGNARERFVTLPYGSDELVDRIVTAFPRGNKTAMVVEGFSTEEHGSRADFTLRRAHCSVYYYRHAEPPGASPSQYLKQALAVSVSKLDWAKLYSQWDAEDAEEARRQRSFELRNAMEELRHRIALESIRILHGANDIEPLKDLAEEYETLCAEAGAELDLDHDQHASYTL